MDQVASKTNMNLWCNVSFRFKIDNTKANVRIMSNCRSSTVSSATSTSKIFTKDQGSASTFSIIVSSPSLGRTEFDGCVRNVGIVAIKDVTEIKAARFFLPETKSLSASANQIGVANLVRFVRIISPPR